MKVKWIGHACFLITASSGLKIITDPYEAGFMGLIKYEPVNESPDIATISHQHGDHNYTGDLEGSPDVIQRIGRHTIKGIEFDGIPCYHDRVSGRERGGNIIFCFTIDDIRICHCGDLGHPLDDAILQSLSNTDVLLVPTGGPAATLELSETMALLADIQPRVTIPMHFRNRKCSFPKYDIGDLLKMKPEAVLAGKSEVEFTRSNLPPGQIIILDPAR